MEYSAVNKHLLMQHIPEIGAELWSWATGNATMCTVFDLQIVDEKLEIYTGLASLNESGEIKRVELGHDRRNVSNYTTEYFNEKGYNQSHYDPEWRSASMYSYPNSSWDYKNRLMRDFSKSELILRVRELEGSS